MSADILRFPSNGDDAADELERLAAKMRTGEISAVALAVSGPDIFARMILGGGNVGDTYALAGMPERLKIDLFAIADEDEEDGAP